MANNIYKGVKAKLTISGVVVAVANEANIRTSHSTTWEGSLGSDIRDPADGLTVVEWSAARKWSGDSQLFRDLQLNRNTFNVEFEIDSVANTKVVASSCQVAEYDVSAGGADDVLTETISGQAQDYYYG